jgi:saccharopine dehydrogenase (NAD+, L-lysine-forming)
MSKILIIGAGGVANVTVHKCAQNPEVFSEILLASRTVAK